MIKFSGLVACSGLASAAHAGEMTEGAYFLVIGSRPSAISVESERDYAALIFRETVSTLSKEWRERCQVPVEMWHTNLMSNPDDPWTSGRLFGYIIVADSEAQAYQDAPATGCISESYAKFGQISYPTTYQICARDPARHPDIYDSLCNQ